MTRSLACKVTLTVGLGLLLTLAVPADVKLDPKLPSYESTTGVSGTISSKGSDTMNNLMNYWGEGFKKFYGNVTVEVEGKGSTTAPPALIAGTANFGPMSRPMKGNEIDAFEKKFGYKPTALRTGIDMLAVYVHKDNPIKSLTLEQVDSIFSQSRKRGGKNITKWGQLGLDGEWANQPISMYGRNPASGTYGFFKEHVLLNGDYKDSVKQQPGSAAVVQGVGNDKFAIGYSGIGYKTANVLAVPLGQDADSIIDPTPANAYTGKYPLSRFLLIYINYKPKSDLDPLRREFIKYIFSKDGQEKVVKDGYFPVTNAIRERTLKGLNITP